MVRRRKGNRYRGTAVVEMAIVLLLLLMLTLGGIRYGWLFLQDQKITNAARHGARMAILPGKTTDEVQQQIIDMLNDVGVTITADNIDFEPDDISSVGAGETIMVSVKVDVDSIDIMPVPLLTELDPPNFAIGASVTMAKEGPFEIIP